MVEIKKFLHSAPRKKVGMKVGVFCLKDYDGLSDAGTEGVTCAAVVDVHDAAAGVAAAVRRAVYTHVVRAARAQ